MPGCVPGYDRGHFRGRRVGATWFLQLTGLSVPLRLVGQVPPQRREIPSEAVIGLGSEHALDFTLEG
jgi:hypothetical protein